MERPEWIFFNLGGTIIDETAAWQDVINRTAAANGISAEAFRAEMERAAANNLPEYYSEALQRFNIPRHEPWDHSYDRLCGGTEKALYDLCGIYRLGIIANRPAETWELMGRFGILKYFDVVTISDEVGFSKPNQLIFREALYRTKTLPQRCFMVGNRLADDIVPAKVLGMGTVWVKREFGGMNTVTDDFNRPDYTVENILQAAELFAD